MKTRRALLVAAVLSLPMLIASCGGSDDTNSGDRPSADEISEAFASQVPDTPGSDAILECLGREIEASELPNGVLRSLAAGETETEIDEGNQEKYDAIVKEIVQTCTAEAIDDAVGAT